MGWVRGGPVRIPHLLPDEPEVLIAARCPGCGAALAWVVDRDAPPAGTHIAHFLFPQPECRTTSAALAVTTACSAARSASPPGLSAPGTTWVRDGPRNALAPGAGLVAGRLDDGYQRRDPSEAQAYFRSVGLADRSGDWRCSRPARAAKPGRRGTRRPVPKAVAGSAGSAAVSVSFTTSPGARPSPSGTGGADRLPRLRRRCHRDRAMTTHPSRIQTRRRAGI